MIDYKEYDLTAKEMAEALFGTLETVFSSFDKDEAMRKLPAEFNPEMVRLSEDFMVNATNMLGEDEKTMVIELFTSLFSEVVLTEEDNEESSEVQ